jgi:hypothetical protein
MLAIIYMLSATIAAIAVVQRLFPRMSPLGRLAGGYVVGVLASAWLTFGVAWALAWATESNLEIGILVTIVVSGGVIGWLGRDLRPAQFKMSLVEGLCLAGSLAFGFWLIGSRLSGDPLTVSAEPWADAAYHITILRSFSEGHNYPPSFPFFGGETMRYHFGTDFFAGALEVGGLPVEWTLNLPGSLGFAAMMIFIFEIGRLLFRSTWVGAIAVIIVITNGSLAFLRFLEFYDLAIYDIDGIISKMWDHRGYLAIGPYARSVGYDGQADMFNNPADRISLFWTPNIWLTQTQLIMGMALVLFVTLGLLGPLKEDRPFTRLQALLLGLVMGGTFWVNGVLWVPAMGFMLVLVVLFVFYRRDLRSDIRRTRKAFGEGRLFGAIGRRLPSLPGRYPELLYFLGPAIILALPQVLWLNGGTGGGAFDFHLGYLTCTTPRATDCYPDFELMESGAWVELVRYWWMNLGVGLPLLILGLVLAKPRERLVGLAVMSIFVFGNLFQLGRDLGGHGHKIFNLWEILISVFAAYGFVALWDLVKRNIKLGDLTINREWINWGLRALMPLIFVALVFSGIIDFMTVKNDPRFGVFSGQEAAIEWIQNETDRDAMFLTVYGDPYTTPGLAGRPLFWGGFEPWTSDKGHDITGRQQIIQQIYGAATKEDACRLLLENDIAYVQIGGSERAGNKFTVNSQLFESQFVRAYTQDAGPLMYFDVAASCEPAAVSR